MPLDIAVTAHDAMLRLGPAFADTSLAHFAPLSLALHLMIESLDPASPLRPYIDVLPGHEELQGALTFGDDALRALTLSPAIASILNLARAYVNVFELVAAGGVPGLSVQGARCPPGACCGAHVGSGSPRTARGLQRRVHVAALSVGDGSGAWARDERANAKR